MIKNFRPKVGAVVTIYNYYYLVQMLTLNHIKCQHKTTFLGQNVLSLFEGSNNGRNCSESPSSSVTHCVWGKGFVACEVAFVPLLTVHMNGAVPECPTS